MVYSVHVCMVPVSQKDGFIILKNVTLDDTREISTDAHIYSLETRKQGHDKEEDRG
jgi:hypothetical protein